MHRVCDIWDISIYQQLDHWKMPVNSFHWFNHQGIRTIAPCNANIVSERVFFLGGGGGGGEGGCEVDV